MRVVMLCAAVALTCASARAAVTLRVVDASGRPVAGASVYAESTELGRLEALTDEGGAATLAAEDVDHACIAASGYASTGVAASSADTPIVLARGASVRGRVLLPDGRTVAGARIAAVAPDLGDCAPSVVTNAAGQYELRGLPADNVRVEATAAGALPARARLRLLAGDVRVLDLRVQPSCDITLILRGPGGMPVTDARVQVLPEWDRYRSDPPVATEVRELVARWRGTPDAEGRVHVPTLPRRASYRIAATAAGLAPRSVRVPAESGVAQAALDLTVGGGVSLRLIGEDEQPWAGARCGLRSDAAVDADLVDAEQPKGSELGVLLLTHLPAGTWTLQLSAPGARPRSVKGVQVAEGQVTAVGDVILDPGAFIAGSVRDEQDAPLAEAAVTLEAHVEGRRAKLEAVSDASGAFRFDGLDPDQRALVKAEAKGHASAELAGVLPDTADLRLVLPRAGALVVVVTDAESGAPVEWPSGWLESDDQLGMEFLERGGLDEPGLLHAPAVTAGTWRLRVQAPGYLPLSRADIVVTGAVEPLRIEAALERGARLEGRVLEAESRRPLEGAKVSARGAAMAEQQAHSGPLGAFVIDGLRGEVDPTVRHARFAEARLAGLDPTVARESIEIVLVPGGAVEGSVRDARGEPVLGAWVQDGVESRASVSDAAGHYRIEGLPEGAVRLTKRNSISGFDGREEAVVTITRGQVAKHDFGGGVRLVGTVTHAGEPQSGLLLSLMEAAPVTTPYSAMGLIKGLAAHSGEDGRYAFAGLVEGRWCLRVPWQGRSFAFDVVLGPGDVERVRDIEIPTLVLGGVAWNDDTSAPLPGVTVTAYPADGTPTRMGMSSSFGDGSGEDLVLESMPGSRDVTGQDGRFQLLLAAPGRYNVWGRPPEGPLKPLANDAPVHDVTASREDLVLHFASARGAKLTVRVLDGETREVLRSAVVYHEQAGGEDHHGSMTFPNAVFEGLAEGSYSVVAFARGLAPAVLDDVRLAEGDDVARDVVLGRGGDVRLRVPDGAVSADNAEWAQLGGGLTILDGSGRHWTSYTQMNGTAIAWNAQQLGPGEWLFRNLPLGRLTFKLGEASASTDVRQGAETTVDLR